MCGPTVFDAGWSSLVARRAHNPKVGGSNPPPATKFNPKKSNTYKFRPDGFLVFSGHFSGHFLNAHGADLTNLLKFFSSETSEPSGLALVTRTHNGAA